MILKIKGRDRFSLERFRVVRRLGLINQERLVHGNCDDEEEEEEVAFPFKVQMVARSRSIIKTTISSPSLSLFLK